MGYEMNLDICDSVVNDMYLIIQNLMGYRASYLILKFQKMIRIKVDSLQILSITTSI